MRTNTMQIKVEKYILLSIYNGGRESEKRIGREFPLTPISFVQEMGGLL